MKLKFAIWIATVTLAADMPLAAHHSFAAEFDAGKAIRLTGALAKIEQALPPARADELRACRERMTSVRTLHVRPVKAC